MNRDPLFADVMSEELHAIDLRRVRELFGLDLGPDERLPEADLRLVETPASPGEKTEARQKRQDEDGAAVSRSR